MSTDRSRHTFPGLGIEIVVEDGSIERRQLSRSPTYGIGRCPDCGWRRVVDGPCLNCADRERLDNE